MWKAGAAGSGDGAPLARSQSLVENGQAQPNAQKNAVGGGRASTGARRPQQRMLNGRVYGARRNQDLFASARSDEPEFVEWGYGGMGSVKAATAGGGAHTVWARVQGSGVSVGAHDPGEGWGARGRAATVDGTPASAQAVARQRAVTDPEDDGGGMAWVKKRREQREREKKEQAEKERKEREEGGAEEKADGGEAAAGDGAPAGRPSLEAGHSQEHVTTAVTLPAPQHRHAHHHHAAEPAPEGEQRARADSVSSSSESTASGASERARAKKDDSTDADGGDEHELEGDDEDFEDDDERTRRTALSAGVEKVSRHIAEGAHHHPDVHTPAAAASPAPEAFPAAPAPAPAPPGPEEARAG
ncbi:hypothetical protein CERSUDRAFT_86521 [Gelatoporia subvermispora B]|uniref:Uncharacterized protein n=1 Tax=Ceriporiopsis subvermispora (strain B) TaxID=914234 RepID=M2PEU6_CERS8|nr:hypothetical protein CERSUDRAFT_86521 [Gelatoporia subvermispora B]